MPAPFDTVYQVMYSAMMRLNDTIDTLQAVTGKVLENPQAFSQQSVNNAWRRSQDYLRNLGYASLTNETSFSGVPAAASTDPLTQTYIDWTGYYDGSVLHTAITLPQDLVWPTDLWERITGQTPAGNMLEMDYILNGLPAAAKSAWNRVWEWRQEKIYMPGATGAVDLRMRYARYLLDFLDGSPLVSTPWYEQIVPVMNVLDMLAWAICFEYAIARAEFQTAAPEFKALSQDAAQLVFNRNVVRPTAIYKASEMSKMRDARTAPLPSGKAPAPLIG